MASRFEKDFEMVDRLGSGGFAVVHQVRHKLDAQLYAVKMMRLKGINSCSLKMAIRETKILASLHHPNVVRYHQAWVDSVLEDYVKFTDESSGMDVEEEADAVSEEVGGGSESEEVLAGSESEEVGAKSDSESEEVSEEVGAESESSDDVSESEEISEEIGAKSEEKVSEDVPDSEEVSEYEDVTGDFFCIQMEYCPSNLFVVLSKDYTADEERAFKYFRQILLAVGYLHEQGIVHRDLKPANIFIDGHDNIRLGDFGLASYPGVEDLELADDGPLDMAVLVYSAPEVALGMVQHAEKVDIYSLGVIWMELLHPFRTAMARFLEFEELIKACKDVLDETASKKLLLARRMLADNPAERPSTVEILELLDDIGSS